MKNTMKMILFIELFVSVKRFGHVSYETKQKRG